MKKLSVIIVNYNVKPFLQQALASVSRALKGMDSEIIVVDNGSGDGSVQLVQREFPDVNIIRNQENAGFAKANNQAIKIADGEVIALVNPDTLIREDTFNVCLDYLESHNDVGAVGCKILNPDGTLQLACRRSFPSPWVAFTKIVGLNAIFPKSKIFGRYNLTYLDPEIITEVEAISGSFMAVKREVIDQTGMLDERFFMYGEDLDWCYRIHKNGWKIVYLPGTEIIHYKGQSAKEAPFDSLRVFYNAMLLFVKKHMGGGLSLIPQWILILGIWIRGSISIAAQWGKRLFVPIIDALLLSAGMIISIFIRFSAAGRAGFYVSAYSLVIPVYSAVWLISLAITGLYRKKNYNISRTFTGVITGLIANTSLTFFFPQYAYSRQVILVSGAINLVLLSGWRILIQFLPRIEKIPFLRNIGITLAKRRLIVVGTGAVTTDIITRLNKRIEKSGEIAGRLAVKEDDFNNAADCEIPILGTIKEIVRLVKVHKIDELIIPPGTLSYKQMLSIVGRTRDTGLDIKIIPKDLDVLIGRSVVESIDEIPFVDLEYRVFLWHNRVLKRALDLSIALIFSPISLLLWFIVLILPDYKLVKVIFPCPGGNILIRELFLHDKKVYGIFRTIFSMVYVLKGKMSIVGLDNESDVLKETVWCRPGITSLFKVSGEEQDTQEERLRYYFYYIRNYSVLLDIEIMLKSIFS
ncbi:glycosyltransferase [bacterium]|nr:glycosyltransferase [bacterium]